MNPKKEKDKKDCKTDQKFYLCLNLGEFCENPGPSLPEGQHNVATLQTPWGTQHTFFQLVHICIKLLSNPRQKWKNHQASLVTNQFGPKNHPTGNTNLPKSPAVSNQTYWDHKLQQKKDQVWPITTSGSTGWSPKSLFQKPWNWHLPSPKSISSGLVHPWDWDVFWPIWERPKDSLFSLAERRLGVPGLPNKTSRKWKTAPGDWMQGAMSVAIFIQ